jgi:opine dehydrogenase
LKVAVLGGGSGGHAMAADLALAGFVVRFFDVPEFKKDLAPVIERGEIEITGVGRTGTAQLHNVTTDIEEAIEGVSVINIVTPAFAHETFYMRLTPYLEDGQIIVTHNGCFGALQLMSILKTAGIEKNIVVSETSILVYGCRKISPGNVHVISMKSAVPFASLPSSNTYETLKVINRLFPQFIPATNVFETSLENLNFILHPPIGLLNAGRIEDTEGDFLFYKQGATPSVSRVMEELDNERIVLETALGLKPTSTRNWLKKMYGSKGRNLYEAIQDTKPYHDPVGGRAPSSFTHRYITEDVPYGLVPLASLGDLANTPAPTAKALINVASIINQTDYWREGLTVDKLGLEGKTAEQVKKLV